MVFIVQFLTLVTHRGRIKLGGFNNGSSKRVNTQGRQWYH